MMTNIASAPFYDKSRVPPRFRPLKAIGHFRNLIADKENTAEVFKIFECLPRQMFVDNARAFCESALGQRLMVSEPFLPHILDDHAMIHQLPEGSVGRAYVEFMTREGLSAAGLVAESAKLGRTRYADQFQWYADRQRDVHDLMHILTGYGRDALGEQCVLAYNFGQEGSWGNALIAYAGGFEVKRSVKGDAPVFAAIREGQRHGGTAKRLVVQDIRALLTEPLAAARARMLVGTPTQYHAAHSKYRERGIDPYNFLASAA